MKQALHIFRKDVTHLWPQTGIVLLLVAAFAAGNVRAYAPDAFDRAQPRLLIDLLGVLVPAAYAWLIVTLVHQEALPGQGQFWLTRPYRLRSLVLAKAAYVVLFVNLSMVAKDCFIVTANGFSVFSDLPGLLLRQFAWTAWVVLPALAAGVVTRNLQEVGLAGAGIAVIYALEGIVVRKSFWPGIEWVRDYLGMILLLTFCSAIVLWQYLRRGTAEARLAVAGAAVLVMAGLPELPWNAAAAVQMRVRRPHLDLSQARVEPDLSRAHPAIPAGGIPMGPVVISLPLQVGGVPAGMTIVPDGTRVAISSGPHQLWNSGWRQNWYGSRAERYRSQVVFIDESIYRALQGQSVTVKLSLGLTLLEDETPVRIPAHQRTFHLASARCENWFPLQYPPPVWCLASLRAQPRTLVALEAPDVAQAVSLTGSWSYAPYEAVLDLSPLAAAPLPFVPLEASAEDTRAIWQRPDAQMVFTPQRPVAHFRQELEFREVQLAWYVQPPRSTVLRAIPTSR